MISAPTLYRQLIKLYPRQFQRQFGAETALLFDDLYRDSAALPAVQRTAMLLGIFFETFTQIIREQLTTKKGLPMPSQFRRPGKRFVISTITALIAFAIIWGMLPDGWIRRCVVAAQIDWQAVSDNHYFMGNHNAGSVDVVASFVKEYVNAKYDASGHTNVGYKSAYAAAPATQTVQYWLQPKQSYQFPGLQGVIKSRYQTIPESFDPLLCSTEKPTAVDYSLGSNSDGYATVVAVYSYPNRQASNVVTYYLQLARTSSEGEWKISDVACTSLDASASKPYILASDVMYDGTIETFGPNYYTFQ